MNSRPLKSSPAGERNEPRQSRSRSTPGPDYRRGHLILMAITIILLLGVMYVFRRFGNSKQPPPTTAAPVSVNKLAYYNRPYKFTIRAPSRDWEIAYNEQVDSLRPENPAAPVLDNINPMLEMRRRDRETVIALVQVGVIGLAQPRTPHSLAAQNLNEMQRDFRSGNDTVRVIQAVTAIAGARVQGVFVVVEAPPSAKSQSRPIWINTFLVHNQLGYAIITQTTKNDYAYLRPDLENILGSFRYLK